MSTNDDDKIQEEALLKLIRVAEDTADKIVLIMPNLEQEHGFTKVA